MFLISPVCRSRIVHNSEKLYGNDKKFRNFSTTKRLELDANFNSDLILPNDELEEDAKIKINTISYTER